MYILQVMTNTKHLGKSANDSSLTLNHETNALPRQTNTRRRAPRGSQVSSKNSSKSQKSRPSQSQQLQRRTATPLDAPAGNRSTANPPRPTAAALASLGGGNPTINDGVGGVLLEPLMPAVPDKLKRGARRSRNHVSNNFREVRVVSCESLLSSYLAGEPSSAGCHLDLPRW